MMCKSKTRTYRIWYAMHYRCRQYKAYTSKNITVCDRWCDYNNFLQDMGPIEHPFTIDRIDNLDNYYPENCRIVKRAIQNRNKSDTRTYEYGGVTKCIAEWAVDYSMCVKTLTHRLNSGLSIHEALHWPLNKKISVTRYEYNGISRSIGEWSKYTGIDRSVIRRRLKRGLNIKEALGQ